MKAYFLRYFNTESFRVQQAIAREARELLLLLLFFSLVSGLILFKVVFFVNTPWHLSFWNVYGVIVTFFLVSRIPYAYLHKDVHDKVYPDSAYPSVSVVIPAKNEEKGIFRTITTCIDSHYPGSKECIVVNDGSTDNTSGEVRRAQALYGDKVKLLSLPEHKGKREAMAVGINESRNDIIIFVDSDSFLAPDAMRHIVEHFLDDEKVGAVSGNTKADNANKNLLTKMQSIQYAISFDIYKASESVHQAVTCCPGCFSAYRKTSVKPLLHLWKEHEFLGSKSTFGDDRGLTNYVLQDWDIVYCEKAKATTKVPESFPVYLRQQLRWKKSWIREGLFATTFMWKKTHPLASLAFYINFTFPILGPILAGVVFWRGIVTSNFLLFPIFLAGFIFLGMVFALFVRVYHKAENWMYIPISSLLFVGVFIYQMPYALLTLRKNAWGTR